MLWFMAHHANDIANERGLGIHFQVLVPLQMIETALVHQVASAYARCQGISIEAFLAAWAAGSNLFRSFSPSEKRFAFLRFGLRSC
jgi:hypothetical protein